MRKIGFAIAALITLAWSLPAFAQAQFKTPGIGSASGAVQMCLNSAGKAIPAGPLCANPVPVSGSFSATLSGFTPGNTFATLTATGSSGSVLLPTGTTVAFQNTGTTTVSCTLGVGSATALANEIIVQAASTVFVTPGSNTWGACIDQSGSTSNLVVLAGGSGLGTGFGGGGGAGGGGSSSITTWGGGTLNSTTVWGTAPTGGQVIGVNANILNSSLAVTGTFWQATQPVSAASLPLPSGAATQTTLAAVLSALGSPFQAGGSIANTSFGATQSGTWTVQPGNTANTTPWLVTVNNTNANGPAAPGSSSPVTPSNQPIGAAAFTPNQVSVGSSATLIAAARTGVSGTGRVSITVVNTTTTPVYLGGSGVTTGTGVPLAGIVGASATFNTTAAIYGIVSTGTATVGEAETY